MTEIPVRLLNQETAKVLARVKAGEEITVTERGVVIAHIVPAAPGPLDGLVTAGRVLPATVSGPAPRATVHAKEGTPEAGDLLRAMRDEERY